MGSVLVVVGVTVLVVAWVRGARRQRLRWLRKLDLPGIWHWQGESGVARAGRLELTGELDGGDYRVVDPDSEERGTWALQGHRLLLTPNGGVDAIGYDLRFFDDGKIGIDGPGRERRIYAKERSNVVPLRRRS